MDFFWSFLGHFVAFLDKFAESSNFFAGSLGSQDSLLECMQKHLHNKPDGIWECKNICTTKQMGFWECKNICTTKVFVKFNVQSRSSSSVPEVTARMIFTRPRCPWGPVYGSRSLSVCPRALVETLLILLWLMMISTQYQLMMPI